MAGPRTRDEFKAYVLRALGDGVIEINVSDAQVEDRIDESLQYFQEYSQHGSLRVYLKHQITQEELDRNATPATPVRATDTVNTDISAEWFEDNLWLPVPDNVLSVLKVFTFDSQFGAASIFNFNFQFLLSDLVNFGSISTVSNLLQYEISRQYFDFLDSVFTGELPIRHKLHQSRLYIDDDWRTSARVGSHFIIEAYVSLDPEDFPKIWNDIFFKRYTIALVKKNWGQNLSKYNGIAMLGGTEYNGSEIYAQGVEELKEVEEKYRGENELPPMFTIG